MEHEASFLAAVLPTFQALQESMLGHTMRASPFLYPTAEILHILGFILLVGPIIALDLRVLGLGRQISLVPMSKLLLSISRLGFLLAISMGFLLFSADAAHVVRNPAFQAKLLLIAVGLVNVAMAHLGSWRQIASWGDDVPSSARITALLSILIWISAVCAGRLIAYF